MDTHRRPDRLTARREPEFLSSAPEEVRHEWRAVAQEVALAHGCRVLSPGAACEMVAFVSRGRVRVYHVGEEGRAVTLYRVERGECCVLTVACLLGGQPFPALAETETDTQAWVVSAADFKGWARRHAFWHEYIFALLGRRLSDVLRCLGDVTFRRVDARLAGALLRRAGPAGRYVTVTQQQLAEEVGTAREVVSRTFTRLKADGLVRVTRSRVELLRRDDLAALATP